RLFGTLLNLCAQFVARGDVVFGLTVPVESLVFGDYAADAVALVNGLGSAKFLEHVDAGGLHEPAEPLRDFAQRNDVVALVLKRWRSDGDAKRRVLCE